jgi:hypothetical protein
MTDTDELDRIWREGLGHLAAPTTPISDPASALSARMRRRHHARVGVLATAAVVLAASMLGVVLTSRRSTETVVHTGPATLPRPLVVDVVDAARGKLTISLPGRKLSGSPSHVNLPPGLVQFEITTLTAGHVLALDGVPGFAATPQTMGTVIRTVQLRPGVYALHCLIPGHTEAGEEILLDVG